MFMNELEIIKNIETLRCIQYSVKVYIITTYRKYTHTYVYRYIYI